MSLEYSLAGMLVGGLVGATGMGGGSLLAPLLIVVFGVPALPAIGSGLIFAAFTNLVASWQHSRLRTVDYRMALQLALGSVPASIVGAIAFSHFFQSSESVERFLKGMLALVLIGVATLLLLRPRLGEPRRRPLGIRPPKWVLTGGGAVVGTMAGMTSAGYGSMTTALLSLTTQGKVVGTVVFHSMLLTVAAGSTHLALGSVDPWLTAALLLGSAPGVMIGSHVTAWISEAHLRALLGSALVGLSVMMLISSVARDPLAPGVAERAEPAAAEQVQEWPAAPPAASDSTVSLGSWLAEIIS